MPLDSHKESAFRPVSGRAEFQKKTGKDLAALYRPASEDLSYRRLRFAEWYLRHKILLQKIGVGFLILWSAVTIGYSSFRWGEYLFFGYWQDLDLIEKQITEFPNYTQTQRGYRAEELLVKHPQAFRAGPGKVDFVAEAANPNERWMARVRYKFVFGGGETDAFETSFLPQSSHPIAVFGYESDIFPTGVRLEIVDMSWRRLDAHAVPDVGAFLFERLMFGVEDVRFTRAERSELPTDQLRFTLSNNSAYGYWQALFSVVLFDGDILSGVVPLTLEQFRSGDIREIDLRFIPDSLSVTDIQAIPLIDVFDSSVYMEPGE